MKIEVFIFNPVQENTFVVSDDVTGDCVIVDAGCMNETEFNRLKSFITVNKLNPVKLVNTHCHFDHIFGVERCRAEWGLKWEAHPGDSFLVQGAVAQAAMFGLQIDPISAAEIELGDGNEIYFGKSALKVICVPGHSPGSICLFSEKDKILIAGDVLFRGSIGRTDLPQGNHNTLIRGIKEKLLVLPGDVKVYPGHGPTTTIEYEKANNPYLQ